MGQIIAFQTRSHEARRAPPPPGGEAQILFFLGVRYLRMEDSQPSAGGLAPDSGDRSNGGKKRKRRARA
jgi:hypothetical protein